VLGSVLISSKLNPNTNPNPNPNTNPYSNPNRVLRDSQFSEILTVYLPAHVARSAVVGFHIVLFNASIHMADRLGLGLGLG
jgi:hypothetical protein